MAIEDTLNSQLSFLCMVARALHQPGTIRLRYGSQVISAIDIDTDDDTLVLEATVVFEPGEELVVVTDDADHELFVVPVSVPGGWPEGAEVPLQIFFGVPQVDLSAVA